MRNGVFEESAGRVSPGKRFRCPFTDYIKTTMARTFWDQGNLI